MEGKIHLVNWEVVCTDKDKGGLGLRKLTMLNKALLGKRVLVRGQRRLIGGRSRGVEGDLERIKVRCPTAFLISLAWAVQRSSTVEEMWDQSSGQGNWNLIFLRISMMGVEYDWGSSPYAEGHKPSLEEDSVLWRQGRSDQFRIKEAYSLLTNSNDTGFPSRSIWWIGCQL
ncbi:hypothetical protein CK203_062401 [Vitis vinifera]|uniref:Uncharacterized protein n=1 Tax=Vitis vinifera TaxID=29760 RepID=A0A438FPX6_VITVI|nr:hypothetical protein CK203_062401 [Vitis vinifera]